MSLSIPEIVDPDSGQTRVPFVHDLVEKATLCSHVSSNCLGARLPASDLRR